jgi:hypothetical protein
MFAQSKEKSPFVETPSAATAEYEVPAAAAKRLVSAMADAA